MKTGSLILCFCFLFLNLIVGRAQQDTTWTLEECIAYALTQNIQILMNP
jgi:hypothetical protein